MATVPRSLRRLLVATSMLIAVPTLLSSFGCKRAEYPSDDDEDEDRPRKKHKKQKRDGDDPFEASGGESRERSGRTWYCAPGDVSACFDTMAACRDRAKYLEGQPKCVTAQSVYCYTHDRYLNATFACFATQSDCQGDQTIAKSQESKGMDTYHNVSRCQAW
jgi:hypothetical protein